MQSLFLWGLSYLLVLGLAARASAESGNLLRNPDFQLKPGGSIAKHWHDNSGWANVAVSYALVLGDNGRQVQQISCTRYKSGAIQFIQRDLPVRKNRTYQLSIRIKGDVETPVEMILRKRHKPYTIYLHKAFTVTDEWQDITYIGTSDSDDSHAVFHVRFADTGRIFISGAEFRDITGLKSHRKISRGNLLANGGFEVGLDRWGVKFRETGGYANALALEYANPKPEIVTKGAAQGSRFLKLSLPERCRVKITSPYVQVQPNRTYTISGWIAASSPRQVTFGLASGYLGTGFKAVNTVSVGKRWKKYTISTQLEPAPDNAYYFFLETSGKGLVFLDGISLRHGGQADYEPAASAEIGFLRQQSPPIVYQGSEAALSIRCVNHAADAAMVAVAATDFWGNEIELIRIKVDAGASLNQKIKLPTDQTGYWLIRAAAKTGHIVADVAERAVVVVPRPAEGRTATSAFGGHVRFNPEMLAYARMLGVKWLRTHPPDATKWFVVEKKRGEFVYFDEPFKAAKEMGFHILGILATTPRWASSAPMDETAESVGGFRSYPTRDLRDWRNYVKHTVTHFKGVIDHWEVWNEPDTRFFKVSGNGVFKAAKPKAYSDLLKIAYTVAKDSNPDAVVIAGGAVREPLPHWTEEIFKVGALGYLDILSYHQYFTERPGARLAKSIASEVVDFKQLISRYDPGRARPIWNTEGGILFTGTNYGNIGEITREYALSPDRGPSYLVRNYVRLLGSGVEKLFFYHLFASYQSDRREGAGFFEWDGSPRPLAAAYAVLAKNIAGCRFVRYETDAPHRAHAVFVNQNRQVSIIWQMDRKASVGSTLAIKKRAGITFLNIMGNDLVPKENNSCYMLQLSPYPVYMIESL